jgi:hypothetical protein
MITIQTERACVLHEVRAEAKERDEHRTYNETQYKESAAPWHMKSTLRMIRKKRRPKKEAAEKRKNTKYVCPLHERHVDGIMINNNRTS